MQLAPSRPEEEVEIGISRNQIYQGIMTRHASHGRSRLS
jgi:hypothetical protein